MQKEHNVEYLSLNMAPLKLKLKLNGLEFEIEGEEQTVKEEFAKFQTFVTDDILSKTSVITPHVVSAPMPLVEGASSSYSIAPRKGDFPVLTEIVKKDLPKSEADWVLIYAFYASSFGEGTFTRKQIREAYEATKRGNVSRYKNLDNSIKKLLNDKYIKMQNDEDFFILDTGRNHVVSILEGKRVASPKKDSKKGASTKNGKATTLAKKIPSIDLDLSKEKVKSLRDFFATNKPQTQKEEVLVAMKWFKDDTENIDISLEEIAYLLGVCSTVPTALRQVLINIQNDGSKWITKTAEGKFKLAASGELHIDDLPKV